MINLQQLPRIMTPNTLGSDLGIEVQSPFKSSGRKKKITIDCEHYVTTKFEEDMMNLGPGKYNMKEEYKQKVIPKNKDTIEKIKNRLS